MHTRLDLAFIIGYVSCEILEVHHHGGQDCLDLIISQHSGVGGYVDGCSGGGEGGLESYTRMLCHDMVSMREEWIACLDYVDLSCGGGWSEVLTLNSLL